MPLGPLSPHARWLESETDRLLHFAQGSRLRDGGFGMLDDDGNVDPAAPVDLLITCRMTHVFALGSLLGRAGGGLLCDHGIHALQHIFKDHVNGGWLREKGATAADAAGSRKEAYAHAFVLLAAASATAAGRPRGRELLDDAVAVIEKYFWSEDEGRSLESWDAAFTTTEDYRGANSNMHSVEAYLAAASATGDQVWVQRALRISDWLINRVARANHWRIVEHYSGAGEEDREYNADDKAHQYRPYGATIGHAFEWARLLLHLRAELGTLAPGWLLEAAVELYANAWAEGWTGDGFVYTTDWSGRPVVPARLHWVIAEAIGASAALAAATGEAWYAHQYQLLWDHAAVHFLDLERGSWHHELDEANQPSASVWSGKPDIYHALQTTLIPRLPLAPALAFALAAGQLDVPGVGHLGY